MAASNSGSVGAKPSGPSDKSHADIGIVCSLAIELGAFLNRCEKVHKYKGDEFVFRGGRYDGIRIAIVEAGMGFARARRATQALIDGHSPDWILSCGFSGALLPEMKIGSIVMATSILDQHGQQLRIDLNAESNPTENLFVGSLLTVDKMVRTVDEKHQLAAEFGAIAVDMESLAVAQIAKENHRRFMAVRSISDDLSGDLPPEIMSIVGPTGAVRAGAAIGALINRPGSLKDMWNLRGQASVAATSLATFLDGVVHQLVPKPKK
jgi:adenosylhomocysteine nucleosidase